MATNPEEFDFDIGDVTGKKGDTGNGISGIELLSTSGLQKTYRINMTNETHFDFVVTDGNGISGASFDADTNELTITFDNGTSFTTPSLKGNPGDDGYSPAVTIETITGGHRITITDKTHPTGQSFDVMDGQGGGGGTSDYTGLTNKPQINGHTLDGNQSADDLGLGTYSKPASGIPKTDLASDVQASLGKADSALQTAPVQSVAGKTGAVNLGAGDVGYDGQATYAAGSVGAKVADLTRQLSDLETRLKSGDEEDADLHLGFYLDENGDLCQVDEEVNNG